MICLTSKLSQKLFVIIAFFFYGFHRSQTSSPLITQIWGVLEKKTNTTSHPNIGSLVTTIDKKWNKMFGGFILKESKSFWRRVDTVIEKKKPQKTGDHIE